jgi:5-methylcytosine-specific restriction enzyme A
MLRPLAKCAQPGCPVRVPRGYCPQHAVRPNVAARRLYARRRWRGTNIRPGLRQQVLLDQAYACAACGQVQQQLEVDHIQKHDGHSALFWNRENLQALCSTCHARKTRRGA